MFNKNKKTILAIVLAGFVTCSTTQVNATTFDSIKNRLGVAVQYIWRSMKNSVQDINLGEIKTDTLNALETNKNVQVGAGIGIATSILNLSSPTIRNLSLNVLKATFHYTKLATMWTFNKMLTNKPLQYFMLGCIATKWQVHFIQNISANHIPIQILENVQFAWPKYYLPNRLLKLHVIITSILPV